MLYLKSANTQTVVGEMVNGYQKFMYMVPFVALFLLVVGWLAVAIGAHLKSVPVLALGTVTVIISGLISIVAYILFADHFGEETRHKKQEARMAVRWGVQITFHASYGFSLYLFGTAIIASETAGACFTAVLTHLFRRTYLFQLSPIQSEFSHLIHEMDTFARTIAGSSAADLVGDLLTTVGGAVPGGAQSKQSSKRFQATRGSQSITGNSGVIPYFGSDIYQLALAATPNHSEQLASTARDGLGPTSKSEQLLRKRRTQVAASRQKSLEDQRAVQHSTPGRRSSATLPQSWSLSPHPCDADKFLSFSSSSSNPMELKLITGTATSGPVIKTTHASLVYVRTLAPSAIPRAARARRSLPSAPDDLLDGAAGHSPEDNREIEAEPIWSIRMSLAASSSHASCPHSEQVNGTPVDSDESQKNTRVVLHKQSDASNQPFMSEV